MQFTFGIYSGINFLKNELYEIIKRVNQNVHASLYLLLFQMAQNQLWNLHYYINRSVWVGCTGVWVWGAGGHLWIHTNFYPSHHFLLSVSFVRHRMNWAAIDFALCLQSNASFTKEYSHASHSKVLVLFPWINHPHLLNPFHFTTQTHLSKWKEKSLNYFKLKSYLA